MNTGSVLTKPAEVLLTVAVGLAGTSLRPAEPFEIGPVTIGGTAAQTAYGLMATATDIAEPDVGINLPEINLTRSDSRWYSYVVRRLRELRNEEYDFSGLQVPTSDVIDRARAVANMLFKSNTPTPSVVPTEDGDVLYVWHKSGWDLEIEVGLEGAAVWARDRRAGREWSGSLVELLAGVSSLLDYLALP